MNTPSPNLLPAVAFLTLVALFAPTLHAQKRTREADAVVQGKVCNAQHQPIGGATVSLDGIEPANVFTLTTDSEGHFRFAAIPAGKYTVHARLSGYQGASEGPFSLGQTDEKSITLVLAKSSSQANDASKIEFSDEPQFTVSGVTDTTNLGGHGSATFVRNRDALSKEAASLTKDVGIQPGSSGKTDAATPIPEEAALRAMLQQHEAAELHAQLAEIEETEGRPLEAVHDYRRAAEMDPSEPHLFAWGAELLLHHAYEPAIEVFGRGHRLYPRSVRMLLGLGAARYAQGTREDAAQTLLEACDLDPSDPNPYLFLGRLQAIENIEMPGWLERLKRFVELHPENAMAHYLYAVALSKQGGEQGTSDNVEGHLREAVQLDPHLGGAYLQLGVLCAQRQDFPGAIAAFQNAIENTPLPDEAHYRLAQIYRTTGNTQKAQEETKLFKQVTDQRNKEAERERHEIPQFVYTLRSQPNSPPLPATPR